MAQKMASLRNLAPIPAPAPAAGASYFVGGAGLMAADKVRQTAEPLPQIEPQPPAGGKRKTAAKQPQPPASPPTRKKSFSEVKDPQVRAYTKMAQRLAEDKLSEHTKIMAQRKKEEEEERRRQGRRGSAVHPSGGDRSRKPKSPSLGRRIVAAIFGGTAGNPPTSSWEIDPDDPRDVYDKTWGQQLEDAYMSQMGSIDDFMRRAAALMQEPKIVESFAKLDKDRSGTVSLKELETVLHESGALTVMYGQLSMSDTAALLKSIDVNNDGECDLWELCSFLVMRHEQLTTERNDGEAMEMAFDMFNVDSNGYVSVEELRSIFGAQNRNSLVGLDAAAFTELLASFGCKDEPGSKGVKMADLKRHPAFQARKAPKPGETKTPG
jgi:Ca2+-binding EF-hand superfamily protein